MPYSLTSSTPSVMALSQAGAGPRVFPFVLLLFFSEFRVILCASKQCFNGSGDQTNQLPCKPDSKADDICCEAGDICLSNGLCKYGPNAARNESIHVDTYQPGCTDQKWNSENCFSGCNALKEPLVQSCYDNRYCCYGTTGCVCSKTSLFELDPATFLTTLPASLATVTGLPTRNSATTTPTSSDPATATASSTSSPTGSPSSSPSHLGVAVGAGLGIGLAVVIIGAVFVFLFLRKKNTHMIAEMPSDGGAQYKEGHSTSLHEAEGHSAPQEIGHIEPPQELDGGEQMKYRHA